jgi:hypothetical protein
MHKIEREIIKASNFKPRQKYSDRQDYLKSLFLATTKMSNDDFDELTDEAADWINSCVQIHNSKGKNADFPEFGEVGASEDDDDAGEDEASDDEADDSDDDAEADSDDADESVDNDEGDTDGDEDAGDEPEAQEDEAEAEEKPAKSKAKKAALGPKKKRGPPKHVEDATLDKWGCIEGSKNSQALALFEKGATSKEVKDQLGGTYYNILGKMVKNGHKVEKEGAIIRLTHKDAASKPAKKSKK